MRYTLSNANKTKHKTSLAWRARFPEFWKTLKMYETQAKEVFSGSCCYKSVKTSIQHTIFLIFH